MRFSGAGWPLGKARGRFVAPYPMVTSRAEGTPYRTSDDFKVAARRSVRAMSALASPLDATCPSMRKSPGKARSASASPRTTLSDAVIKVSFEPAKRISGKTARPPARRSRVRRADTESRAFVRSAPSDVPDVRCASVVTPFSATKSVINSTLTLPLMTIES